MISVNVKNSAMERFHLLYATAKYRKPSPGRVNSFWAWDLIIGFTCFPCNLMELDANMGREIRYFTERYV